MAESVKKGRKKQKLSDIEAHMLKANLLDKRIIKDVSVEGYDNCSYSVYALKLALRKHFASCGNILSVWVINSVTFVRFEGEGAQEKALQLDGSDVGGWTAIVKAAERPINVSFLPRSEMKFSKIYVEGYDTGLAELDIQTALCEIFSSCGVVADVAVIPGSATITIGGEGCVEKALELSGRDVGGMNLFVETGLRETEIPLGRRLIDSNSCGYALGTYSRVVAQKRKKMAMIERKEMKMKMKIEKEKEKEKMKMEKEKMKMEKEKMKMEKEKEKMKVKMEKMKVKMEKKEKEEVGDEYEEGEGEGWRRRRSVRLSLRKRRTS